jgi:hypothetical protein
VFSSYLLGIVTTFPQQEVRTKPGMIQFAQLFDGVFSVDKLWCG